MPKVSAELQGKLDQVGERIAARLAPYFKELEDATNKRLADEAKADPTAHKLSRVMEGRHGMSYRWLYAGKDGRKRDVWFCWTVHRNVAGYFLGWRQVRSKTIVKRDQWIARKAKWRAIAVAERRVAAFKTKRVPPALRANDPPLPPKE